MLVMPRSTQRAHFEPAWRGDRPKALAVVGRRSRGKDGIRAIDQNWQWAWKDTTNHALGGNARNMHWATPRQNLYLFILDPHTNRMRPMTKQERNRPIGEWSDRNVARWRRTMSRKSSRPLTYPAMARIARRHGVYITAELKSSAFGNPIAGRTFVAGARAAKHPPWGMALFGSMPNCEQKCFSVVSAGGSFAVIFGRYQGLRSAYYRAVEHWHVKPTRVW